MTRRSAFAVALLVLVPTLLVSCGRDQPPSALVGADTVATAEREAPLDLAGTTLDGQPLDLADLRGRVVVLNAWASWCGPCRDETPALVSLSEGSDPEDVVVVGLNVTDDPAAAPVERTLLARQPKPKLLTAHPGVGEFHGFRTVVRPRAATGRQRVCVDAIGRYDGPNDVTIGCRTITLP